MMSVNKVILVGNLGRDPEIRVLEGNIKVAKLAIATNERYVTRNGNKIDTTEWHIVSLWRNLAEIAEKHMHKGSRVYIEGKLRTREYSDKEGNKRKVTEIEAENILMLDRRQDDGNGYQNTSGHENSYNSTKENSGENDYNTGAYNDNTSVYSESPEKNNMEDDLPF